MTPLETVRQLFPWNVAPRFADHPLNRIMREHGDYVATGGRGMSGEVLFRLETFYHKLHSENLVIEYDPASGFHYRERLDSDRGLIIRTE